MATLTIKNLPNGLYEELTKSAKANRRSIVAEATVILERGLGRRRLTEEELAVRARDLRERTPTFLRLEDLHKAIDSGRK
jgi:plasmid stability protein